MNKKIIIAVDFDDTITEFKPYPQIAPLNKKAFKYLTKLHKANFRIILWTARRGKSFKQAYKRCTEDFNMTFIEDGKSNVEYGETGKLCADFFIDDKAYSNGKIPWKKIYKFLLKKYRKK